MRVAAAALIALSLAACTKDGNLQLVKEAPETRWRMIDREHR